MSRYSDEHFFTIFVSEECYLPDNKVGIRAFISGNRFSRCEAITVFVRYQHGPVDYDRRLFQQE